MQNQKKSRGLHLGLWVLQVLLAATFGMAGFMKISAPIEQLGESGMSFVNSFSAGMVRFIGISEVLGALGLILPAAFRIKPILTPMAAIGIAIVMVLATVYHLSNSEPFFLTVTLFIMATIIAWGRLTKAPIRAK